MKTKFKHIYFENISEEYPKRKTQVWVCRNNSEDTFLGNIKWYSPWRQYCFYVTDNIILAKSCLTDIAYFVIHLNMEHKK